MTSVNFSDMLKAASEAPGFSALPPGEYDCVVDSANVKQVSDGAKSAIAAQFKVENGPYQGQSCFNQFTLSPENPNALAFFFRHMGAMGLDKDYFAANPQLERVASDLVGRRCRVRVSIRQWQGQDRNQVDAVLPPSGSVRVPPVPSPAAPTSPVPSVPSNAVPVPPVPPVPTAPPAPKPPASHVVPPPVDDDLPF